MKTRADHIAHLELQLTGGKPSDDSELSTRQIGKVIDDCYAAYIVKYIRENGGEPSGAVWLRFPNVPIACETSLPKPGDKTARFYCVLPASPLEFEEGQGIKLVETVQGEEIKRLRPKDVHVFKHLKYAASKFTYWRSSGILNLQGPYEYFNGNGPAKLNLTIAVAPDAASVPDDVPYPCPTDMIAPILEMAEATLRRQLQTPQDLGNDGKSE